MASQDVDSLYDQIRQLDAGSLARLFSLMSGARASVPGIESNTGVCGGDPCIVRTRIPVWLLEQTRRLGASEAELLRSYPTLRAEDLVNAWEYVRRFPGEVQEQIDANESTRPRPISS